MIKNVYHAHFMNFLFAANVWKMMQYKRMNYTYKKKKNTNEWINDHCV